MDRQSKRQSEIRVEKMVSSIQTELDMIANDLYRISWDEGTVVTMQDWEPSILICDERSMTRLDQEITNSKVGTMFRIGWQDLRGCQYFCLTPKVKQYKKYIRNGGEIAFPTVEMCRDHWRIRDGHHRIQALASLGRRTFIVRVDN